MSDERRRLDRAPGERYRGGGVDGVATSGAEASVTGSRARAIVAVAVAATAGAAGLAVLGSFDLELGLVAAAAFIGWAVALAGIWGAGATRPADRVFGRWLALAGGAAAIAAGFILLWAWSRLEGGVLGPLDYLDQRFGALAWLDAVAALAAAGLRAR